MNQSSVINNCSINSVIDFADKYAEENGTCLLYSKSKTFLFLFPFETIIISNYETNPWACLQDKLCELNKHSTIPEWCGFLTYEMGAFSDQEIITPHEKPTVPLAYFQKCALIFCHDNDFCEIFYQEHLLSAEQLDDLNRFKKQQSLNLLKRYKPLKLKIVQPLENRQSYYSKILAIQEEIRAGNVYQVNLSQKLIFQGDCDPFHAFKTIIKLNPAPFCAYFHLKDFTIVSSSPERFLKKVGERLETRPIKGTIARGKDSHQDQLNKLQLLSSLKDRAELLMITDLMRNDLSRVSLAGSVDVLDLCRIEGYLNVHHLLSIITSKINKNYHPVEILRTLFPGGSITGCPKLKAMEYIHIFEKRAREIYTGSIGYICQNGDFDFSIAIRTLLFKNGFVDVQLGGAIVIDSDVEVEYQETLCKGGTLFKVLGYDALL